MKGIRRKREKKVFYRLPNQSGWDWRETEFGREGDHFQQDVGGVFIY